MYCGRLVGWLVVGNKINVLAFARFVEIWRIVGLSEVETTRFDNGNIDTHEYHFYIVLKISPGIFLFPAPLEYALNEPFNLFKLGTIP